MKDHECAYLKYKDRVARLVYPGSTYQRVTLMSKYDGAVFEQVVLFCPYCGEDFRRFCLWQVAGRPTENSILAVAQKAGMEAFQDKEAMAKKSTSQLRDADEEEAVKDKKVRLTKEEKVRKLLKQNGNEILSPTVKDLQEDLNLKEEMLSLKEAEIRSLKGQVLQLRAKLPPVSRHDAEDAVGEIEERLYEPYRADGTLVVSFVEHLHRSFVAAVCRTTAPEGVMHMLELEKNRKMEFLVQWTAQVQAYLQELIKDGRSFKNS